jgi:DNA polymerase-3 subunit alpha
MTKTGKRMAWVTVEDLHGSIEIVCFPGKDGSKPMMGKDGKWAKGTPRPGFENWEQLLKSDEPLLITGNVQINTRDEGTAIAEVIAEEIQSLRAVREKRAKRMELRLPVNLVDDDKLYKLQEIAKKHVGATPVAVSIIIPGEAETLIGSPLKVAATEEFITAVDRLFGSRVVEIG